MILGMSLSAFTLFHVILSLVGIGAGFIAIFGLMADKVYRKWTGLFVATTILTSITGFLFPFKGITPGIILGIFSLIVLFLATIALYGRELSGMWRGVYVISASLALYFNVFVLVAQLYQKVPALNAIAPTPASPIFGISQAVVLVIFIFITWRAFKKFRAA